ncbi:hypothetical protein F441_12889 [Phytophthora nicotianae CJ01A1]|uniref:Uncharacterized protein n=3 Tax=Phytophthora nicotianae TaxID=4792 RepID=V9ESS0_PHYNI|nr:hypothetical protein F443_12922 [Phytophthora nicotianae P1569]ETP11599.1 hypothetical protein F441_12889 [Phytophthora nicotianae CJ01A1]ETP39727.1 hypothetical protein F442_12821 [Phytophthora nicotianae P10297]
MLGDLPEDWKVRYAISQLSLFSWILTCGIPTSSGDLLATDESRQCRKLKLITYSASTP